MASLQTPPGLPSILAGILNLRGTAVAIVRLERLFRMAESQLGLHTPLIILRNRNRPFGLLVPAVSQIISIAPGQVLQTSEDDTFNGCAVGTTNHGAELIHVLSPEQILLENEQHIVNEFREAAQARIAAIEAAL